MFEAKQELKDSIDYFGINLSVRKDLIYSHIATDLDGSIYFYTIEPLYDKLTGTWDYCSLDPPELAKYYKYPYKICYNGSPKESMKCCL